MLDVLFLIVGVVLLIWGVVAVISAEWSWRLNGMINRLFRAHHTEEISPEWMVQSRRLGLAAIVIALINIAMSLVALF